MIRVEEYITIIINNNIFVQLAIGRTKVEQKK
jgi:hypothetical protein